MSRRQKDALRPLSGEERVELERLGRSQAAPAAQVRPVSSNGTETYAKG